VMLRPLIRVPQSSPADPLPIAFFGAKFRCRQAGKIIAKILTYNRFLAFRERFLELETCFSAAVSETRRRKLTGKDRNGRDE